MRLILLLLVLLPTWAHGQPAPAYQQWVRQADEADAAALTKLAKAQPIFARIWFYGQVFDLGEPRVPQSRKDALRPRLQSVVTALDDAEAIRWLNHPDLPRAVSQARGMADAWIANSRAQDPVGPMLGWIQRPELAEAVFYRLQYRAGVALTASRLQGAQTASLPLQTARHLAAGRMLTTQQPVWWRHLAAFHGGEVPPSGPIDADDALTRTLNAHIAGNSRAMRRFGQNALHLAQRRRPNSVYRALVMHLGAMAAGWSGNPRDELTLRVQVLQLIRPLRQPELTAAVLGALIEDLLADASVEPAAPYLTELLALDPAVRTRRPVAETLIAALGQIEKRLTALRSRDDPAVLARALAVYFPVAEAVATPAVGRFARSRPDDALKARIATARVEAGQLALRRGAYGLARQTFDQAAKSWQALNRKDAAARATLHGARAAWHAGKEGEAGAAVKRALPALQGADAARARALLGELRLAAGDPAPAFAHANHGLETLSVKGPARAELHRLAGLALHAAGHPKAAADRLAQAAALAPTDGRLARLNALAQLELGAVDAALDALKSVRDPTQASVMQGCILAGANRIDAALDALKSLGKLGQPHQAWLRLEGMICQIHALQAKGDHGAARTALRIARSTALSVPDPVLLWRLRVLEGTDFAHQKKWLDAAGVWRQAAMGLVDLGAERGARGALLSMRSLAPPRGFSALADPLIDTLVQAAKTDKKSAAIHLKAAISIAHWSAQLRAAPHGSAEREAAYRPAADRAIHRALSRLALARETLSDAAVVGADRARLTRDLARIQSDLTTARVQLHKAAPAWASYLSPQPTTPKAPASGVRVDYHLGASAGHGFVMGADRPIQHFDLPDREALAAQLRPAQAVIDDPAQPPNWKALADPLPLLLPFLNAKTKTGTPLYLHVTGPLTAFAFEALVVDAQTPSFLIERHPIHRIVVAQTPASATPAHGLGIIGPDDKETQRIATAAAAGAPRPANPKSFQADLATHRTQWLAVMADLTAGRLSLTGNAAQHLAEADLAFGPGGVQTVVASRTQGAGAIRRFVGGLHHRGVQAIIWLSARNDADLAFASRLAGALAAGTDAQTALRKVQADTRAAGGIHPHQWARWHIATAP